jgi:hypothetical protein
MSKHILNLTFHIHHVKWSPTIFFMKVLSNELSAFMVQIVVGKFACRK